MNQRCRGTVLLFNRSDPREKKESAGPEGGGLAGDFSRGKEAEIRDGPGDKNTITGESRSITIGLPRSCTHEGEEKRGVVKIPEGKQGSWESTRERKT